MQTDAPQAIRPSLESWSIHTLCDAGAPRAVGYIYGDPRFVDGTHVVTSPIAERLGSTAIRTRSGTFYQLGAPAPSVGDAQ